MEATIREAVQTALGQLGLPTADFVVEHPKDLAHGDYACNVALVIAKVAGQSPRAVAEQLVATLADTMDDVRAITIAGPGFINFHLTREFFSAQTAAVVTAGDAWGKGSDQANEEVLFEYTSPNLFKPLHIGN